MSANIYAPGLFWPMRARWPPLSTARACSRIPPSSSAPLSSSTHIVLEICFPCQHNISLSHHLVTLFLSHSQAFVLAHMHSYSSNPPSHSTFLCSFTFTGSHSRAQPRPQLLVPRLRAGSWRVQPRVTPKRDLIPSRFALRWLESDPQTTQEPPPLPCLAHKGTRLPVTSQRLLAFFVLGGRGDGKRKETEK